MGMNLLKISGFLLLLNILLVQSFELKLEYYANKDCSGSLSKTLPLSTDNAHLECVETNKIKIGNAILTNGECIRVPNINGMENINGIEFGPNVSAKFIWSGWCDGSLPGWAIALIVIVVLGLLGVGIYFMFCHKKRKPARSYLAPTRPQQESPNEYPVAV